MRRSSPLKNSTRNLNHKTRTKNRTPPLPRASLIQKTQNSVTHESLSGWVFCTHTRIRVLLFRSLGTNSNLSLPRPHTTHPSKLNQGANNCPSSSPVTLVTAVAIATIKVGVDWTPEFKVSSPQIFWFSYLSHSEVSESSRRACARFHTQNTAPATKRSDKAYASKYKSVLNCTIERREPVGRRRRDKNWSRWRRRRRRVAKFKTSVCWKFPCVGGGFQVVAARRWK